MNQVPGFVCEECQLVFEENHIRNSRFCPNCQGSLTFATREYARSFARAETANRQSDVFGIFYFNLLGVMVGVPAILFRGLVFSYDITLLDVFAIVFLVGASSVSIAVYLQAVSISRTAKTMNWIAIFLLIFICYSGFVQAGDLIDPVDINLMRLITSGVPVLNIIVLFVNLLLFWRR